CTTNSSPRRGKPPATDTPAADSAPLAWLTVAADVKATRMRVRDAATPKTGWRPTSLPSAAGNTRSGMWLLARSVGGPDRPASRPPLMVTPPRSAGVYVDPYPWVPGAASAMLKPPPGGMLPESKSPSSEVTLWGPLEALVQCTPPPALI